MPTAPRQAICATTTSTSRPTTCRLSAYTGYTYGLQKGYIALNYDFRYAKDTKDNPLYILDWPVNGDSTRFNLLPSTADALSQMMDKGNSYHYTQHKREHQVGLIFFRTLMPGSDLRLSLPLRWLNQNLTYFRRQLSNVSRSHLLFEPSVFFLQQRSWWIEALASMSSRLPDMTLMANYTDDANPLRVISGNPDLKAHPSIRCQGLGIPSFCPPDSTVDGRRLSSDRQRGSLWTDV